MKRHHPGICLYQPEIPQNTGNIGRLAAATACRLHLVRPFGFSTNDKNLRRPGLDYWPFLDLEIHDEPGDLFAAAGQNIAFFSKSASNCYNQVPLDTRLLVFGRETTGLPDEFRRRWGEERFFRIPMFHTGVRSLNLANAVAIVVYDYLSRKGLLQEVQDEPEGSL